MIVYIDPDVEMIEASTEWVWARSEHMHKVGEPVPPELCKRMFRSWVEAGWVQEADGQMELSL